ncbi:Mitochondrial inner membrane organizing system component [Salvia divinorum]|uniref:Mitochondrial inner membrane organizing system component n=1 Tax=Salvia divinorum TaxID=28513 RepID=A0ABD1FRL5_SALDI
MADERKAEIPAKWDACLDLGLRRFVYSSLAGAVSSLLIFRSPATRWVSIAFGAGVGIGSAYSVCSLKYDESPPKLTSNISGAPLPEAE